MISIIICSRYELLSNALLQNIADTIGVQYEIIHIANTCNQYSIFSAYNEGIKRSKFPYLCFIHEDVLFRSNNWGEKLATHLQQPDSGVFGLAGRDIVTRVPASWTVKLPAVNIIQSSKNNRKRTKKRFKPKGFNQSKREVVLLDGVMLCMKRELMNSIKFDENFDGFHGYDFDICIQSAVMGLKNYVMYDIALEHLSRGNPDVIYYRNLIAIFKKWQNHLPLIGASTSEKQKNEITKIEKAGLARLLRKLARRGFSVAEIKSEINYFEKITYGQNRKFRNFLIPFEVFAVKLLNHPKYLLYTKNKPNPLFTETNG